MFFIFLGLFLLLLAIALFSKRTLLQPSVFGFYAMAAFILSIFQDSTWTLIFMFRYFFYIISVFVMVLVPLFLTALAFLILFRSLREHGLRWFEKVFNVIIAVSFLGFVGFTAWGLTNKVHFEFARFISIYSLIALYFTAIFLAYILLNLLIHLLPKQKKHRLILILGSEIGHEGEVLLTLKQRLDKAIAYYHKVPEEDQKQMIFVVSGGLDNHVELIEADQMKAYLISHGIDEVQIIAEKVSKNTYENFFYSKEIIHRIDDKNPILVVTSLYHLARANFFGDSLGVKADYLGSKSAWYLWPYAIVREYLAFLLISKEINYIFLMYIIINGVMQVFRIM